MTITVDGNEAVALVAYAFLTSISACLGLIIRHQAN